MRLFVDNLTNIDFSYLCPKRGLVGETWLTNLELQGDLDDQGMLCDFGIVKKELKAWLDNEVDHRLIVATDNDHIQVSFDNHTQETHLLDQHGQPQLYMRAPRQATTNIPGTEVTPTSLAKYCEQALGSIFGSGIRQLSLSFHPEHIQGPSYHYSHGLKKHQGNCQRIAHGHRSKIEIWKNGAPCLKSMELWALQWQDIYIATREDLIDHKNGQCRFVYQAQQGKFELILPERRCYFIDTDTTVEFIAQHICSCLSKEQPNDHWLVKAYEGFGKGAIAEHTPSS